MSAPDHLPRLATVVPFLDGVADRSWLPGGVLKRLLIDVGAAEQEAPRRKPGWGRRVIGH